MRALPAAILTLTILFPYASVPAAATTPAIAWKTCPEDSDVRCGSLTVPADWAHPSGPSTTLAIALRPATDQAHKLGALFVNPGGPGGSAVQFTFDATTYFGAELRKRFDIVGMDPRGVGRSSPVLCTQNLLDAAPSPIVDTERQYDALVAYNRRLAADCAKHTGPVFGHVDVLSVVRDMDAVRSALGTGRISFYGASYGSLMGEEYARLFPDRLRALVLDGVMDHSGTVDDFLTQETDAAQDSYREFVRWCARNAKCAERGKDIDAVWAGLLARARAGTLVSPYDTTHRQGVFDLLNAAFTAFYDPQWYSFSYYLRDATTPDGKSSGDIGDHSFPDVFCADWRLPVTGFADYHAKLAALAKRAPQMLASPLAVSAVSGCLGWPTPAADPQHPLTSVGVPTLLANALHDPATAYPWAVNVARQLGPKAVLVRYRGWGHVTYDKSPCMSGIVDKYLLTLATPPPGTGCPAVEPKPYGVG